MTRDEELICAPWNRDVFVLWKNGELTWQYAAFLARRVEFHAHVEPFVGPLLPVILFLYDLLFEPEN